MTMIANGGGRGGAWPLAGGGDCAPHSCTRVHAAQADEPMGMAPVIGPQQGPRKLNQHASRRRGM